MSANSRTERNRPVARLITSPGLAALNLSLDATFVTMADFEAALKETRASVTAEMEADYAKIAETLKADAMRPSGGIASASSSMAATSSRRLPSVSRSR